MTDLSDLIARVEAAPKGSRDLDAGIALRFGWRLMHEVWAEPGENFSSGAKPPRYSESIDAALTLLPEGYAVSNLLYWPGEPSYATVLGTKRRPFGKDRRVSWTHASGDGTWTGKAATPALALLAAILRARQAADTESQS